MKEVKRATQTRRLQARAEPQGRGIVEALVSAYDVEYGIGGGQREVVRRGAFSDVDGPVPVYAQHNHERGRPPIGTTEDAHETDRGLVVRARLFLDDSEDARATYAALQAGALTEWSVGFIPTEVREEDRGNLVEVLDAELREVSTVLVGANPDTDTLAVRAGSVDLRARQRREEAARKVGHVLSNMTVPGSLTDRALYALEHSQTFRRLLATAKGHDHSA